MSDIPSFQYIRRMVEDDYAELRDRELEDYLYSRVQQRLPSIVTSTTRPTTNLFRGMRIFESDTGNELVYYGATTGWGKPWNVPWGELGSNTRVTDQAGFNNVAADVANSGITITIPANRSIRYECDMVLVQTVAAGNQQFNLFQGATNLGIVVLDNAVPVGTRTVRISRNVKPAALTAVQFKLQGQVSAGNFAVSAGSTMNSFFRIVDEGPVGNAPAA